MLKMKRIMCSGIVALLFVACTWATDVPVTNGNFETVNDDGKPVGWTFTGKAEDFGVMVHPADSNNLVAFIGPGLIYQTIPDYQLQLGHRVTVAFDVTKLPQSGPMKIGVQLTYEYTRSNGSLGLAYAADMDDALKEIEIFGGDFQHHEVSINIKDPDVDGKTFRPRFYTSIEKDGKKVLLDNITIKDVKPLVGDLNYDGTVNWGDLDMLLANWGICNMVPAAVCTEVGPVPEDLLPERPSDQ